MLVANYPPHGGGSERQCALLSRRLIELGDRVSVITRRLGPAPDDGVPVRRLAAPGREPFRGAVFTLGAVAALLGDRDYDIVHCHGFEALALAGAAARALAGKKLVVKVVTSGRFGDAARLAAFPGGGPIGRVLRRADVVVVLNDEARREMLALGVPDERIAAVANGVEVPASVATERSANLVFCGRLTEQKNVEGLLRAWARTRASRRRRLEIAGDGPRLAALRRLASDLGIAASVDFLGRVAEAPAIAARAAAVVLFSHAEGMSNLVLEAMAAATPVIASDVAGNRQLVRHEETGLLVAAADEEGLAAAIDRLVADPATAARLGAAGRELVAREYEIGRIAQRMHGLYEDVLGQRR